MSETPCINAKYTLTPIKTGYHQYTGAPYYEQVIITKANDSYPIAMVHIDTFYVDRKSDGDRRIYELLEKGLPVNILAVIALSHETERALAEDDEYDVGIPSTLHT